MNTNEDIEIHFGVNYLAHFILTKYFLEHLNKKKENTKKAKIIYVVILCSNCHQYPWDLFYAAHKEIFRGFVQVSLSFIYLFDRNTPE